MGRDKALIPWTGVPMGRRVADALVEAGCAPVFVVGGDPVVLEPLGLPHVADRWPGDGPLGGVISALHAADGRPVLVAACDMPRLSPPTVVAIIAALSGGAEVALAVTDRRHPLCAAWSPGALSALEAAFAEGIRRMSDAIATLRRQEVSVPPQDVENVNAPSDLPR